jgi:hypothetical protein
MSSLLDGETYEHGSLQLTIEFDLDRQGWVVDLTSPPLWNTGHGSTRENTVHSQILIPFAAYEKGDVDDYLNALLALHFEHLGLLDTGW